MLCSKLILPNNYGFNHGVNKTSKWASVSYGIHQGKYWIHRCASFTPNLPCMCTGTELQTSALLRANALLRCKSCMTCFDSNLSWILQVLKYCKFSNHRITKLYKVKIQDSKAAQLEKYEVSAHACIKHKPWGSQRHQNSLRAGGINWSEQMIWALSCPLFSSL